MEHETSEQNAQTIALEKDEVQEANKGSTPTESTQGNGSKILNKTDESIEVKGDHANHEASSEAYNDKFIEIFNGRNNKAQEQWPKDVKLFQPYEMEQILLYDNANCLAVQTFLKMCHLDFQVEPRANAEAMSPSGRVPFIKAGAFIEAELGSIVRFVGTRGISLTGALEEDAKADMTIYMSLVNNVLEMAELYVCWCDKDTYEITSKRNGSVYPWPLNHIENWTKRREVVKKLKVFDWYNKSMAEIHEDIDKCCQSLSERLDENNYFFHDKPTELDALVFGHLFTILTTPLPKSHIADIVRKYDNLIHLVSRIERDYFKRESQVVQ